MAVDPMSINYNLTRLASLNIIDNPADVLNFWNTAMNGSGVFIFLGVVGLVLFLASRKFVDSDSEALSYASLIVTIAALFLFLIKDSSGEKVLGWGFFAIFLIITAISSYLNMINRKY